MNVNKLVGEFTNYSDLPLEEAKKQFEKSIDDRYKATKKRVASLEKFFAITKKCKKLSPNVFDDPVENPANFTKKERTERAKKQEIAYNLMKKYAISNPTQSLVAPNLHLDRDGSTVQRQMQAFITPGDLNITDEELIAFANHMQNASNEERREYIFNKFKKINEVMVKVSQAQTDEEFLELLKNDLPLIKQATEMQMHSDVINAVEKYIGGPLGREMVDVWRKLDRYAVGLSGEITMRLGMMAGPAYQFMDDRYIYDKIDDWIGINEMALETQRESDKEIQDFCMEYKIGVYTIGDLNTVDSALKGMRFNAHFVTPETEELNLRDSVELLKEDMKVKYFKDKDGNDINDMEAIERLKNKEEVQLYNAQGIYQGNTKVINQFSGLHRPDKHRDLDISSPEKRSALKNELKKLQKEIKSAIPWSKRIGGKFNKSELGKAYKELNKLAGKNLAKMDVETLKASISSLQGHMGKALDEESKNGPSAKLRAMDKIANFARNVSETEKYLESRNEVLNGDLSLENKDNNYTLEEAIDVYEKHLAKDPKIASIKDEKERQAVITDRRMCVEFELQSLDKNGKINEAQMKGIDQLCEKRLVYKQVIHDNLPSSRDKEIYQFFKQLGSNLDATRHSSQDKSASLMEGNKKALTYMLQTSNTNGTTVKKAFDKIYKAAEDATKEMFKTSNEKTTNLQYEFISLVQHYMEKFDSKKVEQALEKMKDNPEKLAEKVALLNEQKQHVDFGDIFEEEVASADNLQKSGDDLVKETSVEKEGMEV